LNLFTGGHYVAHNLSSVLDIARVDAEEHVKMTVWSAPGMEKPPFEEAVSSLKSQGRPYRKGDWLGKSWTNHWVHAEFIIPAGWKERDEPVICGFTGRLELTGSRV
jgi:alpha-mannosidase